MEKRLKSAFFNRKTEEVAKDLLGKIITTNLYGIRTSGIIVETEAYLGIKDKACHTFGGKRSPRTEPMYGEPGTVYIYVCYGIHHLFNLVTCAEGVPEAVLIRAIEPLDGVDQMLKRRKKSNLDFRLTSGPGSLSSALGLSKDLSGKNISGQEIYLNEGQYPLNGSRIYSGPRVGVPNSGDHANWQMRFYINGNPWVSKPLKISYPLKS